MLSNQEMYLSLDDISIVPAVTTSIKHRSECNIYYENYKLPIFTAPMSSIVNIDNANIFDSAGINVIIPRTVDLVNRLKLSNRYFIAVGLDEFENKILDLDLKYSEPIKICLDVANGHMTQLLDLCQESKKKFGNKIILMTGNIANPETYDMYAMAGIDYVRVGIGGGNACLTAESVSIHMPLASLISKIYERKANLSRFFYKLPYIVADGGIDSYDKIIKCLALGADYVMCGKIFAQCNEACGETCKKVLYNSGTFKYLSGSELSEAENIINQKHHIIYRQNEDYPILIEQNVDYRKYYGMSTKKAQKEMGKKDLHTSEGVEIIIKIEYNLKGWIENFTDYLRSAMSYCNVNNISDFQKFSQVIHISQSSRLAFKK